MLEEYRIFLENLSFPSFLKLMKATRCTNESVQDFKVQYSCRAQPSFHSLTNNKKRLRVMTLDKDKKAKPSSSKRSSFKKSESKEYPVLPPFAYEAKKATAFLERWVKGQDIHLPFIGRFPFSSRSGGPKVLSLPEKGTPLNNA